MSVFQKLNSALQSLPLQSLQTAGQESLTLENAKQVSKSVFQAASAKADQLKKVTAEKVDQAAEKFAQTTNEWTGREMTKEEVKRNAAIGAAIGTLFTVGPLAIAAIRQANQKSQVSNQPNSTTDQFSTQNLTSTNPTTNQNAAWEQEDLAYDQQLYDQQQDHLQHQDYLNDTIDEQISYNDSFDF